LFLVLSLVFNGFCGAIIALFVVLQLLSMNEGGSRVEPAAADRTDPERPTRAVFG
jgi:hypothetical protein